MVSVTCIESWEESVESCAEKLKIMHATRMAGRKESGFSRKRKNFLKNSFV